ncbi:MAG: DNA-binding NtrC family response regulator [Flavobacteriales bacterium]|jgi:DNA-binding NtrC family response regulator
MTEKKNSILIADDDEGILSALSMLLRAEGYSSVTASSPQQALSAIHRQDFSLVLMDLNYSLDTTSGNEGLELIAAIRLVDEELPIVVMTGWGSIEVAVNTMKEGANDFVQKPWENERLLSILQNQCALASAKKNSDKLSQHNQLLKEQANPSVSVVARSQASKSVLAMIEQIAESDVSVLFTGENGTGKSMYARYLHDISGRRESDLISVNMGAVTETLFESEMFGHVKGAFTDAKANRIGRFELADSGSLFLDEIANTPYSQQAKLLHVLEERQFEKVGARKTESTDFRLICATNADLNRAVGDGTFRKDLLYRINTVEIEIPALRHRVEDIIPLAQGFLSKCAEKYGKPLLEISSAAEELLKKYDWPGNVRELGHVIERAQILCRGSTIEVNDLGLQKYSSAPEVANNTGAASLLDSMNVDLRPLSDLEYDLIDKRLQYFDGDAQKAAKSLGLSRSAFYRRLGKNKE